MKKTLRRIGRTRFMIIILLLLAVVCYCYSGLPGVIGAIIGWCLGALIYDWKKYKTRIINFLRRCDKRFGRRTFRIIFSTVFCSPLIIYFTYRDGWRGLGVSIIGICIGHLISNKIFKD